MNKQLKFKDGKFKIMVLGDIHERLVIDNKEDELKQKDAHKLFEMGVKAFQPDLVVLLGDTCSEYQECEDYTLLHKQALERILKPILDANIPMCYVLGNHEHDAGKEKEIVKYYNNFFFILSEYTSVNDLYKQDEIELFPSYFSITLSIAFEYFFSSISNPFLLK